jgi:S1-C subfamily serine protease/rhodanese-related sulfurtransferase
VSVVTAYCGRTPSQARRSAGPRLGLILAAGLAVLLLVAAGWAADARPGSATLLKAKPAVVLITSEVAAEVRFTCPGGPAATVAPRPQRANGTGYLLGPDGYLATNAHVLGAYLGEDDRELRAEFLSQAVQRACLDPGAPPERRAAMLQRLQARVAATAEVDLRRTLSVVLANGERFTPEVVAYSPPLAGGTPPPAARAGRATRESGKDVAILKIEATNLPALVLADSDRVQVGEPVRILGYPGVVLEHDYLDRRTALEVSVTSGLVSSLKRDARGTPVIQTDAAASWGNSGGPALNERGEVVGMLTFISLTADETQAVQGFNFLVPSNVVREFVRAAGVPGRSSAFNTAWHDAVDRVAGGDWLGARASLDAADRLVGNLPDVRRLRAEVEVNLLRPRPWPAAGVLGAAAAGLAALAVGGGWLVRRRRQRAGPSPAAASPPLGALPEPVRLSAPDLARALAERLPLVVLDVRAEGPYAESGVQIKGARRVAPDAVLDGCSALARDQAVVCYCDSPGEEASRRAATLLLAHGYTRVAVLAGGLAAWQDAGQALTRTRAVAGAAPPAPPLALPRPGPPVAPGGLETRGEFPVGVKGIRPYFNARASRVRMTGLTLDADQPLAVGETVRLTIFLEGEALEMSGRIAEARRRDGGGWEMDAAFDSLPEETAIALEGFILAHRSNGRAA